MIAISRKQVFELGLMELPHWIIAERVIPLTGGAVTVELPNGRVLARVDDGTWAENPVGTAGGFERAKVTAAFITFMPRPGQPETFFYLELP